LVRLLDSRKEKDVFEVHYKANTGKRITGVHVGLEIANPRPSLWSW
jgi:hypothetical protein